MTLSPVEIARKVLEAGEAAKRVRTSREQIVRLRVRTQLCFDLEADYIRRPNSSSGFLTNAVDELKRDLGYQTIRDLCDLALAAEEAKTLARAVIELSAENERRGALLLRIHGWDHMDTAGDGPYWRGEIDAVLSPTEGDGRTGAVGSVVENQEGPK